MPSLFPWRGAERLFFLPGRYLFIEPVEVFLPAGIARRDFYHPLHDGLSLSQCGLGFFGIIGATIDVAKMPIAYGQAALPVGVVGLGACQPLGNRQSITV